MAQDIPHHIQKLLTLFMEGESTLEQEEELARFFRNHHVGEQWKPYRQMFAYFDSGMDNNALPAPTKSKNTKRHFWHYAAAAAVLAAVIAVAVTVSHLNRGNGSIETTFSKNTPSEITTMEQTPTAKSQKAVETVAKPEQEKTALALLPRHTGHSVKRDKATHSKSKDSIEIVHTQAALEAAEQEILADRLLLEEELQQTQRQRPATNVQSGWVTTSLNIQ